jgi:HAE1 family hydrophobic/amphiphilic exporter-1
MAAMEQVFAETRPQGMGFDYWGMSYQEKKAQQGDSPALIFGLCILFAFLILAALHESWTLPFTVLLSVPIAVFGALTLYLRRFDSFSFENTVYAQTGLIMLIGLTAKNAILIVEFAKAEYEPGRTLADAALEGAKPRLRPILMTSFAFILGCVPLWRASGSGAISRKVMGFAVIGGMLAASAIAIFIIPALFYMIERLGDAKVGGTVSKSPESLGGAPKQPGSAH